MSDHNNRQPFIFAAVVFLLTLLTWYYVPDYPVITASGLLIVIILSVFSTDKRSTIIAGTISSLAMVLSGIHANRNAFNTESFSQHLFLVILIIFASLIVLYVKRLYRNIRADKTHMTSLFENATEGIVLTDAEGKIILFNPAAEKMFDLTADEVLGKTIEVLLPERYTGRHVGMRQGFLQKPQNRSMGAGRDLFARKKDGTEFPVEISLSHYQKEHESFVIAFVVDITQRKEIEKDIIRQQKELERISGQLRKLNTELEGKVEERTLILKEALQQLEVSQHELKEALDKERQLNEIKGRFVSMASHEFRTPLSTVLSSASLLGKYTETEQQEKRDRHINKIKESVKHLNDILEDFLSLGKLDEGKIEAQPVAFNCSELIQDTVDEIRGLLKKGQEVQIRMDGPAAICSDKKLVKNILINLLTNASKFSGEKDPIEVDYCNEFGEVRLSVRDHGIGISEEDQEHLFSSFFRGANATNIQGTGLGLHIVKRYADLLNGRVNLHSELGKGTTITVSIPVTQD